MRGVRAQATPSVFSRVQCTAASMSADFRAGLEAARHPSRGAEEPSFGHQLGEEDGEQGGGQALQGAENRCL